MALEPRLTILSRCYDFCPLDALINQAKQNYMLASCSISFSTASSTAPPPRWNEGSRTGYQNNILHQPGKLAGIFIGGTLAFGILLLGLITIAFRIRRKGKSRAEERENGAEGTGVENVLRLEVGMGGEVKRKIDDEGKGDAGERGSEDSDHRNDEFGTEDEVDMQGNHMVRKDIMEDIVKKWENEVNYKAVEEKA